MAEPGHHLLLLVVSMLCVLARSKVVTSSGICGTTEIPVVRNISELGQASYGRAGLSHMTITGSVHHGMREVEVWMQTFAPGSGTPIHRHACEEVFITLKGSGTLYLARNAQAATPGQPEEFHVYQNATFTIPVDAVHQVLNTNEVEDLQLIVIISRPPMKSFQYGDWSTPHDKAVFNPKEWDKHGIHRSTSQQCPARKLDVGGMSAFSRMDDDVLLSSLYFKKNPLRSYGATLV